MPERGKAVRVERRGPVTTVILNRPEVRNAVDRPTAAALVTAFVEIYQNCPIYNDDAFLPLTDPAERDDRLIRLEHGQPIRFGPEGRNGLRFSPVGSLEPVPVAEAAPESLLTHDAHAADPSYAFALSRLDDAGFAHAPIGVIRKTPRPSYDELMSAQLEQAREEQGDGDLGALLAGGDTWSVG